jgi:hypothetical protein
MATNALMIEFGSNGPMNAEVMQSIQRTLDILNGMKKDKTVEEYRLYPVVTGNRTERVALLLLEVSHQQLEALVVNKAYAELLTEITKTSTNVTVNRAITLERMLELAKQMM